MQEKSSRIIPEHNKEEWQPLDEVEKFETGIRGRWVQQGPYIVNKSGKLDYAIYIGMDKVLMGVDMEGKPVVEDRLEV